MLTLKHIIWDGGFETIYQAKEVRAKYPEANTSGGPKGGPEFVSFDLPNGDVRKLDFGKVYVMNGDGKTVSSYNLGNEPIPVNQRDGWFVSEAGTETMASQCTSAPAAL
jgi:hypothetical protein